jgi:hypothetical protein
VPGWDFRRTVRLSAESPVFFTPAQKRRGGAFTGAATTKRGRRTPQLQFQPIFRLRSTWDVSGW